MSAGELCNGVRAGELCDGGNRVFHSLHLISQCHTKYDNLSYVQMHWM